MTTPSKTVRWVDDPRHGTGAVKLVTGRGATVAKVRPPARSARDQRWWFTCGRRGGKARDKAMAMLVCETWAVDRGYVVEGGGGL